MLLARRFGFIGLSLALLVGGCADGDVGGRGGDGGGGGGDDLAGDGNGSQDFSGLGIGGTDDGGVLPEQCATDTQQATQLPLDIYMMLDTSGSMSGTVMGSTTKWDAVQTAITSFVNDPKSAGIGLGLQYFPLLVPGSTAQSCANDAACGALTPCINNRACAKAGAVQFCQLDADCGGGGVKCQDLGTCAIGGALCLKGGSFGCLIGPCNYFSLSYCSGRDKCTIADYATPAVPIAPLPGVAMSVITSMSSHGPDGLTPTGPALQGTLDQARSYATAHSGHTVVAVLATDGFPTECTPQDIPSIATIAMSGAAGSPSIKTFVIGVFSASEQAQATTNLNQIAAAGGTTQAFVISTTQNVSQAFLAALDQIRGSSLPCEYTLPVPMSGTPDYNAVNVQFSSGGKSYLIGNVKGAGSCDPTKGGWYYDVDPTTATPTKVILCPATCSAVKADPAGRVDVVQGCVTIIG